MRCPHCQEEIDEKNLNCPFCQTTVNESPSSIKTPEDSNHILPAPEVKKKKMPLWFKLAILLTVLALIGVTAGILFTESWVDAVDLQLEALRDHNVSKAYDVYTSKDFKATTSREDFQKFIEAHPIFFNNQSTHFSKRSIEDQIGTLRGHLSSNDHIDTPIEYKLVKEDKKWKILSIRLLKPRKSKRNPFQKIETSFQMN